MNCEEFVHTWTRGYREYSGKQGVYLSKEKIHFLQWLIYSRLVWEEMWEVCRERSSGKLAFVWFGGKKGHLSVHPQQTGIGKKPKNGFQQPPRKEGGNDLTLGFSCLSRSESYFQPFSPRQSHSIHKKGRGRGGGAGREDWKQPDTGGEARGVLSRNFCWRTSERAPGLHWDETPVLILPFSAQCSTSLAAPFIFAHLRWHMQNSELSFHVFAIAFWHQNISEKKKAVDSRIVEGKKH